jgi:hypothetical protein
MLLHMIERSDYDIIAGSAYSDTLIALGLTAIYCKFRQDSEVSWIAAVVGRDKLDIYL